MVKKKKGELTLHPNAHLLGKKIKTFALHTNARSKKKEGNTIKTKKWSTVKKKRTKQLFYTFFFNSVLCVIIIVTARKKKTI